MLTTDLFENKAPVGRLSDRMRDCIHCGSRWFLSPREAGRYHAKGQELPRRCQPWRESRRLERDLDDAA
jgi:hypothetical protein